MKILGINHIGIAAKDPQKASWFFREILGLPFGGEELVREQKTNTIMYQACHKDQIAMARLEILENQEGEEGPIAKYLEKKGGGIHHVALQVDSVEAAIKHLLDSEIEMIDKNPAAELTIQRSPLFILELPVVSLSN